MEKFHILNVVIIRLIPDPCLASAILVNISYAMREHLPEKNFVIYYSLAILQL